MKKFLCKLVVLTLFFGMFSVQAQAKTRARILSKKAPVDQLKSVDDLSTTFNNQIKIIFCDIDGTIIPKNYPKNMVPESVKHAAKKLNAAKIPMVLATGRSYEEAQKITNTIGIKDSYYVTLQGAEIIDNKGKIIYMDLIDNKDARRILKHLDKYVKANCPEAKIYVYFNERPSSTKIFRMPYYWQTVAVVKSYDALGAFTPSKIGVLENNPEKLRQIRDYLKTAFPDYNSYLSTDCFCELTTYTATKGNGVKKVCDAMGIDLKNAATFGDAENDLSMTSLVKSSGGLAVVVKNAMEILKKNANYETKSVNEGGVNYAVDRILENNARLNKVNEVQTVH